MHPECSTILVYPSHFQEVPDWLEQLGIDDLMSKPVDTHQLVSAVESLVLLPRSPKTDSETTWYKEASEICYKSDKMKEVMRLVERAASVDVPVLITGETGTGKNTIARIIHLGWSGLNENLISINCAALPGSLIESELFGHEKGSFTGASVVHKGIFEMAKGGTLLLDEITEIPIHLQSKLLSVLEDRQVRRIGGDSVLPVRFRLMAATSANLEYVLGKTFRYDLYYRLNVLQIHIPPLRERLEDIPLLCQQMLGELNMDPVAIIKEDEMERLMNYHWPGNTRELKNVIHRAAIFQPGPELKPSELLGDLPWQPQSRSKSNSAMEVFQLQEVEKQHILKVLEYCNGNQAQAAKKLGISISTLKRRIRSYRSV
jgi:transcriptional regulator with PAS, ATPase and Fis domain